MNRAGNATVSLQDRDALASALRDALAEADTAGRLPASAVRALRARLDGSPADGPLNTLWELERLLGPFESLPVGVQNALIRELEADERWRLRGYELGGWHSGTVRLLRSRRVKRLAKKFSERGVAVVRDKPRQSLYALYRAASVWKGRHAARPAAGSVLRAAGLDPRSLIVYYARGLSQHEAYRGFWRDPARNVMVGSILGVDLLPSPAGLWYLESNLNPAFRPARADLYGEDDPFVANILRVAQAGGYRRVVIVLGNNQSLDPVMAGRFEKQSAQRKIALTLLEDKFVRRSRYDRTFGVPEARERDTLIVRMKLYPTNLDHVFHSKRGCHRALGIYQGRSEDRDVLLPPTSDDPVASDYDPKLPFPNLVYKMPDVDLGAGVVFLRAPSLEKARELVTAEIRTRRSGKLRGKPPARASHLFDDHRGVFQPYIVGSMLEGRRLYYVRSHVLVTPTGPQFLSAHRIVCAHSVPGELRDGIVRDRRPYFWSFDKGATFERLPPDEEAQAVAATLAVARGLSAAAEYSFETGPS